LGFSLAQGLFTGKRRGLFYKYDGGKKKKKLGCSFKGKITCFLRISHRGSCPLTVPAAEGKIALLH
jgi:hypothetical protein